MNGFFRRLLTARKLIKEQKAELEYELYYIEEMIEVYTEDIRSLNDGVYKNYLKGKRDGFKEIHKDLKKIVKI
ncbi:hypothetical protein [Paenibacillus polymyxa]|uniref:hypothetical protein n=1 Tax=Paenibacillus polymyxa TaxID=1406 RepID=UPI00042796D4|nr:hypothetical protein [Paenibacillus polymyxa]